MKKRVMFLLLIISVALLAACSDDDNEGIKREEVEPQEAVTISDAEKIANDEVVAIVNDVELHGELYNLVYTQTKIEFQQFEQDVEDLERIKQSAIDLLIGRELAVQDAKEQGIEVSEEEVDEAFSEFKEEAEDRYTLFIEEYDLTDDAFKEQFRFSLIHEEYLKLDDFHVTDEEAEEKYAELEKDTEEIPDFDDIKDQVKMGIKQDKLDEKVEQLKEAADIEIK
ncbi:MAG TPA: SurA N-terminal domain-containing protein [Bacillota bacterium]|nr:SurA N-terminal domain-containing protein [Bacillota bacterium]